jgi:membrane protease YdiL (CAAX protease family)
VNAGRGRPMTDRELGLLLGSVGVILLASGLWVRWRYRDRTPPWRLRLLNHGAPLAAALAAMVWNRRAPHEYGFTLRNWRDSLRAVPPRLAPGAALLALSWTSRPPARAPQVDRMARMLAEMPLPEMLPYHALVALGEEALFRGLLQRELADRDLAPISLGPVPVEGAVARAAAVFGLFHLVNLTLRPALATLGQAAFATLFGINIGSLARRHGTLIGPVVIHMLSNVLSMLALRRQLRLTAQTGATDA